MRAIPKYLMLFVRLHFLQAYHRTAYFPCIFWFTRTRQVQSTETTHDPRALYSPLSSLPEHMKFLLTSSCHTMVNGSCFLFF